MVRDDNSSLEPSDEKEKIMFYLYKVTYKRNKKARTVLKVQIPLPPRPAQPPRQQSANRTFDLLTLKGIYLSDGHHMCTSI